MKIIILSVGRLKAGPERDLAQRYAERFEASARALGLSGPVMVEIAESQARSAAERKTQEAQLLLAALPDDAQAIRLDERGETLGSEVFARNLVQWRDIGRKSLVFIIGGADGLGEAVAERVPRCLSFGAMTMPHQLVRVLLLEQIYRAGTILSGHPYHRI
ncbi:MAG: 23S rRNA (pseudouridine(1915)-N(3))-methyltransferase RlmH [Beijerinckiaceae bacterium]